MGVLSFPFLFKDRAHANRTLADPAIAQKMASLLESKGIIGCGQIATADVRYMTRNPIHKIADFEGKKLRINGTDAEQERFRRLGRDVHPDESRRHADCAAEQDDRRLGQRHDDLGQLQPRDRVEGAAADRGHVDRRPIAR